MKISKVFVNVSLNDLLNQELGVDDIDITAENLKKYWSASVSVTYKGYGGNASATFDMKTKVNVSPINYFKIESISMTGKSGHTNTIEGWDINYTPGVTYSYKIDGSKITINTSNSTGGYGDGSMYYGSTITSTYLIKGWLL